jgi:tetratricopeptide (TPR) repeat protein
LEANPYPIAVEAFDKSKALDQGKSGSLVNNAMGIPLLNNQIDAMLAQSYLNKSLSAYQNEKNYKSAYDYMKRVLYFIPEDTTMLMNAGVYFGPAAEEFDESLVHIRKYIEKGGKSGDAYIQLFSIYRDRKKDNEAALAVAKEMVAKFPTNSEYPKYELDMYVKMNRLPEAKSVMERQAAANPSDKESRYFLGVISSEMKDEKEARKWFQEAVNLDEKYFDAQLGLAEVVYYDAKKIKAEMNQLGNSKGDLAKKIALDKEYQDKLRIAMPYFEKCEKLSPDEARVLDSLYIIYTDLEMTAQVTRIEKRMKTLGLLD